MLGKKNFELESVRRQKSAEVDALMRLHGYSFSKACRRVALDPRNYISGEPPIVWLPSPEQINEFAKAFKSGDLVVNGRSRRLPVESAVTDAQGDDEMDEASDLDAVAPEPFELPAWFTA